MEEVIGKCPICGKELYVTQLSCKNCDTVINSNLKLCKFCKLSKEQKIFVEVFIKNRGNIKEIEKELSISYPTVRNKLEEIIEELGYEKKKTEQINKKSILEKLSRGEIDKDEAIKKLSGK